MSTIVLELLASRICHDLISPVGAVHNGVEFLQEMGDSNDEAVSLIAHSAQQAAAKLQAFRLAYGAGGRDPNIKPADIKDAFADLIDADGKVTQDWDPQSISTDDLPLGFCKVLMGTMMLAQECLPKGGSINITQDSDHHVNIKAAGSDAAPRPQMAEALNTSLAAEDLDPRLVHPYALSTLAQHYGFQITITDQQEGSVTLRVAKTS